MYSESGLRRNEKSDTMRFLWAADEVFPIHLEFVTHNRLQLEKANKKDFKKIINPLFHRPEQRKRSLSS